MQREVYQLSEEYFRRLRRLHFTYTIPLMAIAGAVGLFPSSRSSGSWVSTVVAAVILIAVCAVVIRNTYLRQQRQWRTFRITLTADSIERTQEGYSPVTLRAGEIRRIRSTPRQGLEIWASGAVPALNIPETLERYAECGSALAQWCPVEEARRPSLLRRLRWPLGLAAMAGVLVVNSSTNPAIVLPAGGGLVVLMVASLIMLQRNPDIDVRTKRLTWVFVMVILQLVFRMYAVFAAAHAQQIPSALSGQAVNAQLSGGRPQ